ncbi:MAG: carbohydrate binding family 9 domain-containing protein [Saprospiraceae bacterium]|nr:carbohydrate binding family 9 domain-containing protein [Saprospiraceae bacterium]
MKEITTFLLAFLPILLLAQEEVPKRKYFTKKIQGDAPKIDGKPTDDAWAQVEWSGDYVEWSPEENTEPTEQTALKILYDSKHIYVAFRCYDSQPDSIVKRLSRRDGFDGDWVEINIGSLADNRTAQSFTVSVTGVIGDEYISNDGGNWDVTWNPIYYAKTNIDDLGWTAEMRIPMSQLRFGKGDQVWGIQSTRRFFRKEERSVWQRSPQGAAGWVSSFGELHGLEDLQPQKQLEIQPYVVGALERFPEETGNPFRDGKENQLRVGVDGKIGVTNDLIVDFTINPDFGQVEADPSAIALDGFQIFFQERRPFFIENKNIFDYQFSFTQAAVNTYSFDNLFYSRRIGRAPQRTIFPDNNEFVNTPNTSDILGAVKFSGKTKNGWSIGILESITGEENAQIWNGETEREEVVEPLTNYFVGRVQKDFNENKTIIGGIFTSTNRDITPDVDFLHQSAYTGGLDFLHQWRNRDYYIKGNVVSSSISGSETAIERTQRSITHLFQRSDAEHLDVDASQTQLSGTGGAVVVGKNGGNWRFETAGMFRTPGLELNDIGFQLRADDIRHSTWVGYRTTEATDNFRAVRYNYNHLAAWDFEGNFNQLEVNGNAWLNTMNNSWLNAFAAHVPIDYSVTNLRGGPRLRLEPLTRFGVNFNTDSRKKLRAANFINYATRNNDAFQRLSLGTSLTLQPSNALSVSLSPNFSTSTDQMQYVATRSSDLGDRYIIGEIDQETLSFPLRLDYLINPNLSIQYWGQPFISRGTFNNLNYISNPTAASLTDRFVTIKQESIQIDENQFLIDENLDNTIDYSFFDPDFSFVQFRSNLVGRWEYIPGSELFLVWSQDNSVFGFPENDLLSNLENEITENEPENIFLIKATYRFIK